MQRILSFISRLGFWPYIFLFTAIAVLLSELLIILQSYWLKGGFFDRDLLIVGFITPAVDAFIVFLFTAYLIRHLLRIQKELKQSEEKLSATNRRLTEAQEIAHMGFWEFDLQHGRLYWSDEVYRIFGLAPGKFQPDYERFLEYVHPDDRELLDREYRSSVEARRPYQMTHRIFRKDGTLRYVEEHCRHTYDEKGGTIKSLGTIYDVTERISDQQKLQRLFDLQTNIIIQTDGRRLKKANRSFLRFLGYDSLEAFLEWHECICDLFIPHEKFFHLGKVPGEQNWIDALALLPKKERIVSLLDTSLQAHAFSVAVNHFEDDDYLVTFTDISDTILTQFSLEEKVSHDHLTGAYSREFVEENMRHFIERAEKHHRQLGIIFFDIDHFKKVNDTFGHPVGDKVLIQLVKTLKEHIRSDDVLVRWGGEEFVMIAETHSIETLTKMAEQIRRRIGAASFGAVKNLTCSFGIAVHDAAQPIDQTIRQADDALYRAKAQGRNRVCSAQQ